MTKREVAELLPTMKVRADENNELDIAFEEMQVVITSLKDIETSFGKKLVASVEANEKAFNLFVNATSQQLLIEAFGDDDEQWKGKFVDLKLEKNEKFKNNMIIMYPVA